MVGRVYISDPKERTRVAATRVRCLRVALANEIAPEEEPLVKELTEDETEPEMPLKLSRTPEGRFVARLPFLPGPMPANNFFSAKHRHDRLQSRLERHDMTKEYESNLMEYVKNGHAAPVDSEVPWTEEAFYLPHREVIKEGSSTTRFRIVFDASANSPSLNERLFKGNAEQLNLAANLMSFRKHPVAVIADISKAFLQIEIVPEHRKYLRFLWKTEEGLKIFEMCRLPFGLVSSPAILMTAIQQLIEEHSTSHPFSANLLRDAFYMDDLVLSVPSPEDARQLRTEAMEIFASAGFTLAKWDTNVPELQQEWNGQKSAVLAKVLGTMWNQASDTLSVRNPTVPELGKVTPREMMKFIGSVFDVLGLLEPVKLSLKKMARAAIVQKIPWDETVLASEFRAFLKRFSDLAQIQVPRHVPPPTAVSFFSDASEDGLGYVIYFTDSHQQNYFVYGKSRLAPLKPRTMPELELAALTEAVEQLPSLCRLFDLTGVPLFFWSDSSITLHRLDSNLNRHGSYVANRLVRIHRVCESYPSNFRYVPTKINPADVYSRPKTVRQLLKEAPSDFRVELDELVERTETMQLPKLFLSCPVRSTAQSLVDLDGFERIGEWSKLVRVARRVLQFRYALEKRPEPPSVQDALSYVYRSIQQQCLGELPQVKLPTETDNQGIIRIRTRVADYRPIWLPKSSRIAEMVVRHAHAQTGHHMRRRFTKALINERYYIPRVNQIIDRVLKYCVPCQKARRRHVVQPVGDLPAFRTREFLPFECVGIDYLGPMQINDGTKRWVLLVTCSVSRAIHLEVVSDLSSASCLAALNCVFNYRGYPRVVFSDNGTNFTAAEQDLKKLRKATQKAKDQIYEFGITWYFNPPRASWWGGLFERMVGVVKNGLRKVAGPKTDTQLRYLLAELMAVVNSRPLFSSDSERDPVITPGHYLIGRSYKSVPQGPGVLNSFRALNQVKKWRQRFIRYWRSEYLQQLGLHYKQVKKTDINPGDLVLMVDDNDEIWKLARIEAVDRGPDGV
ncbi:PREDICTED: uncharacterized protein LOC108354472, partial [Rhagoletis zephyria]|uniref:uncharacterized protein LOC108354472 n=1 Tax=Rhagoletis zephyria TaxID=28612 RepID=UPI000811AA3E